MAPTSQRHCWRLFGNRKEERFSSQYMKAKFANQMKHGEEMAI
jgi:hypothetical protein